MAPGLIDRKHPQFLLTPTNFNHVAAESKRKVVDDDAASNSSKRIKTSHTVSPSPEKKPVVNVVPFPERVGNCFTLNLQLTDKSLQSRRFLKSVMVKSSSGW